MATTTTTTRSKRRKVAAILLVGLGITSLGVASASHLNVTAAGDPVASGVATVVSPKSLDIEGARVSVLYQDVINKSEATTLAHEAVLAPTLNLELIGAANVPDNTSIRVYFYKDSGNDPVATANVKYVPGHDTYQLDDVFDKSAFPAYDRVAVVVQDNVYKAGSK